jgi:RNA polymerase sigma-70 factor (ECF subfamily)
VNDAMLTSTNDAAERTFERAALRRAIARLPQALRDVVVLKLLEGFSHQEIAELLDISTVASQVRLTRALKLLRASIGPAFQ